MRGKEKAGLCKEVAEAASFQQITLPRLHGTLVGPSGQEGEEEEEAHAISWLVSSLSFVKLIVI